MTILFNHGESTQIAKGDTFAHMKKIRISDLHIKTSEWVRKAARGKGVVTTERGRPMASLIPFAEGSLNRSFRDRQTGIEKFGVKAVTPQEYLKLTGINK